MASPTKQTIKILFAKSGNTCAYPGCTTPIVEGKTILGQICHINASRPGGPRYDPIQSDRERHGFENLMLLCGTCHKRIDSNPDKFPADDLRQIKRLHEEYAGPPDQCDEKHIAVRLLQETNIINAPNNSGNIVFDSPGAVIAEKVSFRAGSRSAAKIIAPPGTVGNDADATRYIQYLIKRYNEFASKDPSRRTKFNYGVISRNITSKFGTEWRLMPMARFEDLCDYLKGRINRTRIAKSNKSKGYASYSTFEDYLLKL